MCKIHTKYISPLTYSDTHNRAFFCFDLCKYKKSENEPSLYHLYYSELLESCTDFIRIFTDGSKDGDKTAAAFVCQ